ncbi:MAG: hypothetical protein RL071_2299 [Pseudomonadota bacterium]
MSRPPPPASRTVAPPVGAPRPSASRPAVRVLVAGLALSVEACATTPSTTAPTAPTTASAPTVPGVDPAVAPTQAPAGPAPVAGPPGAPAPAGPAADPLIPPPMNPPPPLPRWEDVASSHPKGATNPPSPVLEVSLDGDRCWKAWRGGMIRPTVEEAAIGGRVILEGQVGSGTEIVCPSTEAAQLLQTWRAQGR